MAVRQKAVRFAVLWTTVSLVVFLPYWPSSGGSKMDALCDHEFAGPLKVFRSECFADKKSALERYVQSFDMIAKGSKPLLDGLGIPIPNVFSDESRGLLDEWMKRRSDRLRAMFGVIEAVPQVPDTCALEEEGGELPIKPKGASYAPLVFWTLATGRNFRELVEVQDSSLTTYGKPLALGVPEGYDIQYTKASTLRGKELARGDDLGWAGADTLVITCTVERLRKRYMLQSTWRVPSTTFKSEVELVAFLRACGPEFYAYDMEKRTTAYFRRAVEDLPEAKPSVDW